jgi:putative thioredoxin
MTDSENIINVSEADFEYEVVAYSQKTPVVVDFWAEWCVPCKTLGPLLKRLAVEANGNFRLAKINVDENPRLAREFIVRSIPAVKAFQDGRVVAEFVGMQPEPKIREFIQALTPTPVDLLLEKGQSQLDSHQWANAEKTFREYLEINPGRPAAVLGLLKSVLPQGKAAEALQLLRQFPPSREFASAQVIQPLAEALVDLKNRGESSDDPLEAAFNRSLRLATRGNLPAAVDGLLDILRQEKAYRNGEVKRLVLGLLEILGDQDPQTRQYRSELASILF